MKPVVVTGSNGGIGSAVCDRLAADGYTVIGIDREPDRNGLKFFVHLDILDLVNFESTRQSLKEKISGFVGDAGLEGLVNNAAVQIVQNIELMDVDDFSDLIKVNLNGPFVVAQLLWSSLLAAGGTIINIGSIHASLTKPGFAAYAASKAGLNGLTRAMAVEASGRLRAVAIEPAAISTSMLEDGFRGKEALRSQLASHHPSGRIGRPDEIASLVAFLLGPDCTFLNGEVIGVNGAIASRLHDPT